MEMSVKIVNTFPVIEDEGYVDPKPIVHEFKLSNQRCLNDILEWYGAFYAGDPYTVTVNGRILNLDKNGCVATTTIEGGGVTILLPNA
jgi:hypothetical protein